MKLSNINFPCKYEYVLATNLCFEQTWGVLRRKSIYLHNFLYYLYFSTKKLSERFKRVRLFWNLKLSSWFVKSWHFELTFCFLVSISRYKMHCKSLLDSEHFSNWNELGIRKEIFPIRNCYHFNLTFCKFVL